MTMISGSFHNVEIKGKNVQGKSLIFSEIAAIIIR